MSRPCLKLMIFMIIFAFVIMVRPYQNHAAELFLSAGAGLRQPTDLLVEAFERETGHRVYINYGGSGKMMVGILASGREDLFMPGSIFYIEQLREKGLINSSVPIVSHTPVIGVCRKTDHMIRDFGDLKKPGIRIALGDPKAMAFGKTAMVILERSGQKDAILKNVVVYGATVKQLALYTAQGDVDAAIIGRADAFQFKDRIDIIAIPESYFQSEIIAVAVLKKIGDSAGGSFVAGFFKFSQSKADF